MAVEASRGRHQQPLGLGVQVGSSWGLCTLCSWCSLCPWVRAQPSFVFKHTWDAWMQWLPGKEPSALQPGPSAADLGQSTHGGSAHTAVLTPPARAV